MSHCHRLSNTKQLAIQEWFYHFKLNKSTDEKIALFVCIQWIVNVQTVGTFANCCWGKIDWTEACLNYDLTEKCIWGWEQINWWFLLLALFILQSFMISKLNNPSASHKRNNTCDILFYVDASFIVSQFEFRMGVRKLNVRVNILIASE